MPGEPENQSSLTRVALTTSRRAKSNFLSFIFMTRLTLVALTMLAAILSWGCSAPRPVPYPNEHYEKVGKEQFNRDLAECEAKAREHIKSRAGQETAKSTAAGSATGGAMGAAGGAVRGNAGTGAATGAAVGATGGLIRGASKSKQPSPAFKKFVEECLREKGYKIVGWD
jgi:hypothetical protein